MDHPLNEAGTVHAVKITKAHLDNIPDIVQPKPRNPFEWIFFPPVVQTASEPVLDHLVRERETDIAITNLLPRTRIHPTTEVAPIPFPTSMSSLPERMFKELEKLALQILEPGNGFNHEKNPLLSK